MPDLGRVCTLSLGDGISSKDGERGKSSKGGMEKENILFEKEKGSSIQYSLELR